MAELRCRMHGCEEAAEPGLTVCLAHQLELREAEEFEKGIRRTRQRRPCVWPNCERITPTTYCPEHRLAARRATWRRSKRRAREDMAETA